MAALLATQVYFLMSVLQHLSHESKMSKRAAHAENASGFT
jgi:hypothetical protein